MTPADLETVLDYHERTKHHPYRSAASLGYLDWANQPDPFRRFEGAELFELPLSAGGGVPPLHLLDSPAAAAPLQLGSLGRFLELALGITAWKAHEGVRWALRANPSSGNLHPTEGYVVLPPLEELGGEAGVFHYRPLEHALERRCLLERDVWEALAASLPPGAFLVGLSSVLWREVWKYGERAFRYCQHDVGHALAASSYAARTCGWYLRATAAPGDAEVAALLGLDRLEDFAEAEREHPDLLAVVTPSPPASSDCPACWSTEVLAAVRASDWHGRANRLSREHHPWPLVDDVAEWTRKPASAAVGAPWNVAPRAPLSAIPVTSAPGADELIRRRRSAVSFDGHTGMERERFYATLQRLVPRPGVAPWDALCWEPSLFLAIFVHRVVDLEPGLYILPCSPTHLEDLGAQLRNEFEWQPVESVPEDLPLYLLKAGDFQHVAAALSCNQEIAADGVFSLGMLVEYRPRLEHFGPWFYRRLYWEAGLLGQVLYLQAEAAGLRATGIGCFFDDEMHRLLGLSGDRFQSLYHIAFGGPIEDTRVTTLPAYDRPRTG